MLLHQVVLGPNSRWFRFPSVVWGHASTGLNGCDPRGRSSITVQWHGMERRKEENVENDGSSLDRKTIENPPSMPRAHQLPGLLQVDTWELLGDKVTHALLIL